MNFASTITVISVILILTFIALAIFFFRKAKKIKSSFPDKKARQVARPEIFNEHWQAVLNHLDSGNEGEWKLAIIEADKLADDLLIQKGYEGESMAERLSMINKRELKSLDLLWEAHKIRNRIAHKLNFKINRSEALRVISYYEEALKDLRGL